MSNLLFDWGNRTPEQNAMQRRLEELGIMEQAINFGLSQSGQTGGVGGGSTLYQTQAQTLETVILMVDELNGTNFTYYVANYAKNTLTGPFNTNISFTDYSITDQKGLYNKGYFFLFRLDSDPNDYKMLFLDASGTIVGLKEGYTSDLTINYYGGRWLVANDYDARFLWYFDGETLTENLTYLQSADNSFNIGCNFDSANASGFALSTVKTNGDNTFCFATNSGINEIFSHNTVSEPDLSYGMYLYNMANLAVIEENDASSGFFTSLTFFSLPTGLQVEEFNLTAGEYTNKFGQYRYGSGNYLWLYYNAAEWLIINYRANTETFETTTLSKTDYPDVAETYDQFSLYSHNSYPMHDTFALVFYDYADTPVANLSTVSAAKVVYSVNGGAFSEYDLKVPGPGTINIKPSVSVSKNTVFMLTDTFESKYTAVVFTSGLTYVHPLGIELADYDGFSNIKSGEKHCFSLQLDAGDSKFFVIDSTGTTCTQTSLPEHIINLERDYDAVLVLGPTKEWRLNNSTDSLVEIPRFGDATTSEPYTNSGLRETGIIVETVSPRIQYTHTQMTDPPVNDTEEAALEDFAMDGAVVAGTQNDFGPGSSYFTNLYPGLFVLCAKNINITSFSITGNIGADGEGDMEANAPGGTVTVGGQVYTYYVKRVFGISDPSINQIIIVKGNGSGINQIVDATTQNDTHVLTGIPASATELHYLLLAQPDGAKIENAEVSQIVDDYLTIVHGKNINTVLADLNTDYATVTANVPDLYLFNDVPETSSSIDDGGNDMYDGANVILTNRSATSARIIKSTSLTNFVNFPPLYEIIENGLTMIGVLYYDGLNNGKVSVKIYNTNGVLKQYIKTPHFEYDDFDIVGTRAILVAKDKVFDGVDTYRNTTIYSITPTSYKSKNYKSIDANGFVVRAMNDVTWYD